MFSLIPEVIDLFTNIREIPYPEAFQEYEKNLEKSKTSKKSKEKSQKNYSPKSRKVNKESSESVKNCSIIELSDDEIAEFLGQINHYRALHGSPPLIYDRSMADHAGRRAQELLATPEPSPNDSPYGEVTQILPAFDRSKPTFKQLIDGWYGERVNYTTLYMSEPSPMEFPKFERFSQMVWKRSKGVAVGVAVNQSQASVVACFSPAGNEFGWFGLNVQPAFKVIPNKKSMMQ